MPSVAPAHADDTLVTAAVAQQQAAAIGIKIVPVKPSQYIHSTLMSTADRLKQPSSHIPEIIELADNVDLFQKDFTVPLDQPLFKPVPSEVVLQNFEPFQTYEVLISFRNMDKFPRKIRVDPIQHSAFSIRGFKSDALTSTKTATGIEVPYVLKFTPQEQKDYFYDLICSTERERFVVPIRAIGSRAILDFPDEVNFSDCPVRFNSTKTLLVRNVGAQAANYKITCPSPFRVQPDQGFLPVQGSAQIDVEFFPKETGYYQDQLTVEYETGEQMVVSLSGGAEDVDVRLEKNQMRMQSTYATLSTSQTVKIVNRSDIMAKFSWKLLATEAEEQAYRMTYRADTERDEAFEKDHLREENREDVSTQLSLIERRFKAIDQNRFMFESDVFVVEPSEGIVWPNSHTEVTVSFRPEVAGFHETTLYCEVSGRETRLPLSIKGEAFGPRAEFNFDILNIEEVFINHARRYEAVITNIGEVEVRYAMVIPDTIFAPKFTFTPSSGVLGVGQSHSIHIEFQSDILGEFNEEFQWELEGASNPLTLTFRGRVVGPTFHFDHFDVDLGVVPYGFETVKRLRFSNTSKIAMSYKLRLSEEDVAPNEYLITPSSGQLGPMESVDVDLTFRPRHVKKYDAHLMVDVRDVGDNLLCLPFFAQSYVPKITVNTPQLSYGDCFLGYAYSQTIELVNDAHHPVRFVFIAQEESAQSVYAYDAAPQYGVIPAHSVQTLEVKVEFKRLGRIDFPVFVKIAGAEDVPISIGVTANGIGPNVTLSATDLNWGRIDVLVPQSLKLSLNNDSLIDANFTCRTNHDTSVFNIRPSHGVVPPGETIEITLTARLDDPINFNDVLSICIMTGETYHVRLSAKGIGTTITFSEDLNAIDFGNIFTNNECIKDFFVTNKGRRTQNVMLMMETPRQRKASASVGATQTSAFVVQPNRLTLKSGITERVIVMGWTDTPGLVREYLQISSFYDKSPTKTPIMSAELVANFIHPVVSCIPSHLQFVSKTEDDNPVQVQEQVLLMRNTTTLPVHMSLSISEPFTISPMLPDYCLDAGEEMKLKVFFMPEFYPQRLCRKETSRIVIEYAEHPNKDVIPITADILYPNIQLSTTAVDFGCVPVSTEIVRNFSIKNVSELAAVYDWSFVQNDPSGVEEIKPAFDIIPTRGILQPGETENFEAIFNGYNKGEYAVTAACRVVGGPVYEVKLSGSASSLSYTFDAPSMDFGSNSYQEVMRRQLRIENNGPVSFDFKAIVPPNVANRIAIMPGNGTITPYSCRQIQVMFCAGIPESVAGEFYVQIANELPTPIQFTGTGTFMALQVDLPKDRDAQQQAMFDLLKKQRDRPANRFLFDQSSPIAGESAAHLDSAKVDVGSVLAQLEHDAEFSTLKTRNDMLLAQMARDFNMSVFDGLDPVGCLSLFYKNHGKISRGMIKTRIADFGQIPISKYKCEFGDVTRGQSIRKSIKLTNINSTPMSLVLDRTGLTISGIVIEPDKFRVLQPNESVELNIILNSGNTTRDGPLRGFINIDAVGGPRSVIYLSGNVAMPDMVLTPQDLEFGKVIIGHRKSIQVQIFNPLCVPCEWTTRPLPSVKDSFKMERLPDEFEILPPSGMLGPSEYGLITVRYTPKSEKTIDMIYNFRLVINNKPLPVRLKARGLEVKVEHEPKSLTMGPILPFHEGHDAHVTLSNPMDFPIEIVAVDFDEKYAEEWALLKESDEFHNGMIVLPPRHAGQGLPEELVTAVTRKRQMAEEAANADPDAPGRAEPVVIDKSVNVILHGPPLSGKTTQAKKLASSFGVPTFNLDEILEAVARPVATEQKRPTSGGSANANSSQNEITSQISEDVLEMTLTAHLQQPEYAKGFVLQGLDSRFLDNPASTLKTVLKCLGPTKRSYLQLLFLDQQQIRDREVAKEQQDRSKEPVLPVELKSFSEQEYIALSVEERAQYDAAVEKFKRTRREAAERKRQERVTVDLTKVDEPKKEGGDEKKKGRGKEKDKTRKTKGGKPEELKAAGRKSEKYDDDASRVDEEAFQFLNDNTAFEFEKFNAGLESLLALFKDIEKASLAAQQRHAAVADKKSTKQKQAVASYVETGQGSLLQSFNETELRLVANVPPLMFVELPAGDEETTFKAICDALPTPPRSIKTPLQPLKPHTCMEQILTAPKEHNVAALLQHFNIVSSPASLEPEDESNTVRGSSRPMSSTTSLEKLGLSKRESKAGLPEEADDDDASPTYRWLLQPGEKRDIVVRFTSTLVGKFQHTLNFELVGCNSTFSVMCAGTCQYTYISSDLKRLLAKHAHPPSRRDRDKNNVIPEVNNLGTYVDSTNTFDYGVLLAGRPKEKYAEKAPENKMSLPIVNTSQFEANVSFAVKNDIKGDVFFLEPSQMELAPGQSGVLNVWAYPKVVGKTEDMVVCCVKDNPQPVTFKLTCTGVRPEVELEKKVIQIEKVLLNRVDVTELKLINKSAIPAAWRLAGTETMGDEFDVSPIDGIVEANSETKIEMKFCSPKPVYLKKALRLDISDAEKLIGVIQTENINITAEAYDVAIDLHFPRSNDGALDFGVNKVYEETKLPCNIKNRGKYDVEFKFVFDSKDIASRFTITPQQGIVTATDKALGVQFVYRSNDEVTIKDSASLKCMLVEPTTQDVIGTIPVRINARSVFSKFNIFPAHDLNFGAILLGNKVTKIFTIENTGEFDFRFALTKSDRTLKDRDHRRKQTREERLQKREPVKAAESTSFGPFQIYPTSGLVQSGTKSTVTVEYLSETIGAYEELLDIDISDRSPLENKDALEYRLYGECCVPGINTTDFVSIFEDHVVMKRLDLYSNMSNFYAEDDRVFYFGALLTGQQAQARYKISNPYKIPCEISISCRPRIKIAKTETNDFAFDVEPKKLNIPPHEYRYVNVSFHPSALQTYTGIFEAVVESSVGDTKNKVLTYELRGEGTLPRVTVEKPAARNKNGLPQLKFRRQLINTLQTQAIVLRNDGIMPAKVKIDWQAKDCDDFEFSANDSFVSLRPQESKSIDIRCRPSAVRQFEAELRLRVLDNSFEDTTISLAAEGYQDEVVFEYPNGADNEVHFGGCLINETRKIQFTAVNHSMEVVRVNWAPAGDFVLSPTTAHLRPHETKEFFVTYCPKGPVDKVEVKVAGKISKIRYPTGQIPTEGWDDRVRQIRWNGGDDKSKGGKKVLENSPEPRFDVVSNLPDQNVTLTAFADYSTYECDQGVVHFRETMMFQSRAYRFPIRNTGRIKLDYKFVFSTAGSTSSLNGGSNEDDLPFEVLPRKGSIMPDESLMVTVRFAPMEVGDFKAALMCVMANLADGKKSPVFSLSGTSSRPFCHFDLPDSDYIASRRNVDVSTRIQTLEANTRAIEFESCGIKVRNTKRFFILNPTEITYDFEWTCEIPEAPHQVFKCLTPKGTVMAGKKFEIVFEYTPETIDLQEALWHFSIRNHNISVPFLLVGVATEPNVYIDRASVNFKSVLVSHHSREVVRLVNLENAPFQFSFNETTIETGPDNTPVLRFSPMAGTIGPNSELPIEITFTPWAEKNYNFNLMCNVRKKPTPVIINVKGEGYDIHEKLMVDLTDGEVLELASGTDAANTLDFGQIQINEKRSKRIVINNYGKFPFDFRWSFLSKTTSMISITPEFGTVAKDDRAVCDVIFLPVNSVQLRSTKAVCNITNGRQYPLTLMGSGASPKLKFSKLTHNFGPCFLHASGIEAPSAVISVKNEDSREISFDIGAPDNACFDILTAATVLTPGESTTIKVNFYPRDVRHYQTVIPVEINGLSMVRLHMEGEGVPLRVEVQSADMRAVNFGAMRIGYMATKTVKIVNRSIVPVKFNIGPQQKIESLQQHAVTLSTAGDVFLRPKTVMTVEIKFNPKARIPPFTEEVLMSAPGISKPLFVVSGACQGVEVALDTDLLPFGAVVHRSSTTRRVHLQNVGDIGVQFKWTPGDFAPDFEINPIDGYIAPGMDVPLEITFKPSKIHQHIRYADLRCDIEGGKPLHLTLTGACVQAPVASENVRFSIPVRQTETKSISLTNKSLTHWQIRPVIDNPFWTGPELFEVESGQTKSYEITYAPLEMTAENGRHEGSVFFPLPDGNGQLYRLYGVSEKPQCEGTLTRDLTCKTNHVEVLKVRNWLKRPQRFHVTIDMPKTDPAITLKGLEYIDVPGSMSRDYKLNFFAYREGVTAAKIWFTNEQTQEYVYYQVTLRSAGVGTSGTIDLETAVRRNLSRDISIYNPLPTPVTFTVACTASEVALPHTFTVQPKSDGVCSMEFLPLHAKESSGKLTLNSTELGLYQYDIKLNALPPSLERSMQFKVGLGNAQTQTFRFMSYAKVKCEYTCRIDSADFTVERTIFAPAATSGSVEVSVDVTYEPSKLGDTRTTLYVTSPIGGDYACPLFGHCTAPRPQGPIVIKQAGPATANINFKNVYPNASNFTFTIDNPSFTVKPLENIPGKKAIVVTVTYKPVNAKSPKTAKMIVTCPGSVSWTYYLKAV